MNIFVVCHFGLYQDLSSSFVHNQIREYVREGHSVRVLVPNALGKPDRAGARLGPVLNISRVDGVEIYDLRFFSASGRGRKEFNARSAIAAIRLQWGKIFKDFTPDIIHAHTLGFDSRIGSLEAGKDADIIIVDDAINVQRTIKKGRTIYVA